MYRHQYRKVVNTIDRIVSVRGIDISEFAVTSFTLRFIYHYPWTAVFGYLTAGVSDWPSMLTTRMCVKATTAVPQRCMMSSARSPKSVVPWTRGYG